MVMSTSTSSIGVVSVTSCVLSASLTIAVSVYGVPAAGVASVTVAW